MAESVRNSNKDIAVGPSRESKRKSTPIDAKRAANVGVKDPNRTPNRKDTP